MQTYSCIRHGGKVDVVDSCRSTVSDYEKSPDVEGTGVGPVFKVIDEIRMLFPAPKLISNNRPIVVFVPYINKIKYLTLFKEILAFSD